MSPRFKRQYDNLLLDAVDHAIDNDRMTIDLFRIPTTRSFGVNNANANRREICRIVDKWIEDGFGSTRDDPSGSLVFALNKRAFDYARRIRREAQHRAFVRKIMKPSWSAVATGSALIAAIASVVSAYFSYLSLAK